MPELALNLFPKIMNKKYDIEELLTSWGHEQRQSPTNEGVLKAEMLSKSSPSFLGEQSHHHIAWLPLVFTGLALLILIINPVQNNFSAPKVGVPSEDFVQRSFDRESKTVVAPEQDYYYKYQSLGIPISDDREFLKRYYNSTLQTRNVESLTNKVRTVIRGFDGRIDSLNSSGEWGYVDFVVPASRFEAFQMEIKSLVGSKFYTEQVSIQNLLPEKQLIEKDKKQAEENVHQLRSSRKQLIGNYNKTISKLQSELNSDNKELIEAQIANENKIHDQKLSSLNAKIRDSETILENIKEQDKNLIDNVATVQGTISIDKISIWEMVEAYLPGSNFFWIFLAVALGTYLWHRRTSRAPIIW